MQSFMQWMETIVRGSVAGDAMKRTLEFKVDAEWIKWDVEKKGWISDGRTKDSFDLAAAFHHSKVAKPAFFYLRAHAILESPDAEYDSISGGKEMKIQATMFLFNGRTGLSGRTVGKDPETIRGILETMGHVRLSERGEKISYPGFLSEFDGPSLRTPLQLAEWVNKVVENTDIEDEGDGDDDHPEDSGVPGAGGRIPVKV